MVWPGYSGSLECIRYLEGFPRRFRILPQIGAEIALVENCTFC